MTLAQDKPVIQALPANRADDTFDLRILPRRMSDCEHGLDCNIVESTADPDSPEWVVIWKLPPDGPYELFNEWMRERQAPCATVAEVFPVSSSFLLVKETRGVLPVFTAIFTK